MVKSGFTSKILPADMFVDESNKWKERLATVAFTIYIFRMCHQLFVNKHQCDSTDAGKSCLSASERILHAHW